MSDPSPAQLRLSLAGISLTFTEFTTDPFRLPVYNGSDLFTAAGYPIDRQPYYEPKYLWTVGAFLRTDSTSTAMRKLMDLQNLFKESNHRIRKNLANPYPSLQDLCLKFSERDAMTRATCDAPYNVTTTINYGSVQYVEYYAKFLVRFTDRIEFEPARDCVNVKFSLVEGG